MDGPPPALTVDDAGKYAGVCLLADELDSEGELKRAITIPPLFQQLLGSGVDVLVSVAALARLMREAVTIVLPKIRTHLLLAVRTGITELPAPMLHRIKRLDIQKLRTSNISERILDISFTNRMDSVVGIHVIFTCLCKNRNSSGRSRNKSPLFPCVAVNRSYPPR